MEREVGMAERLRPGARMDKLEKQVTGLKRELKALQSGTVSALESLAHDVGYVQGQLDAHLQLPEALRHIKLRKGG